MRRNNYRSIARQQQFDLALDKGRNVVGLHAGTAGNRDPGIEHQRAGLVAVVEKYIAAEQDGADDKHVNIKFHYEILGFDLSLCR